MKVFPFSKKTTYALTPTQELLLALLRAQLWLKPVDDIILPSTMQEYDDLMDLGYRQTVICFIAAACLRHKDVDKIPAEIREEMQAVLEENKKIHEYHNKTIVEVFDLLEGEGLHPILLKGQGLAQLYPQPELRQCGDIDIFCPSEFSCTAEILNKICKNSFSSETIQNCTHALEYLYNDIVVDLQAHLCVKNRNDQFHRFDKWAKSWLSIERSKWIMIDNSEVCVPNFYFVLLFSLFHFWKHLVYTGCCIRHLADFAVVIDTLPDEQLCYIKKYIRNDLKYLELEEAWDICCSLITDNLTYGSSGCFDYNHRASSKFMRHVLDTGFLGENQIHDISYVRLFSLELYLRVLYEKRIKTIFKRILNFYLNNIHILLVNN